MDANITVSVERNGDLELPEHSGLRLPPRDRQPVLTIVLGYVPCLRSEGNELVAEVSDDGRGFKPETVPGVGLRSMRERVVCVGGTPEIESEPGTGTRIRSRVPMPMME